MISVTAKRERKFNRAKARPLDMRRTDWFDAYYVVGLDVECAYEAVSESFAWLSLDHIRKPPRKMKDAQLARQVAIHVMASVLWLPQRAIARHQGRQRTNLHFAVRTVDQRLECSVFAQAYDRIAARALELHDQRFVQAA